MDVRILTPGGNTDQKAVWYAGRAHYEELLQAGIRLYEYEPTMLHAKTDVAGSGTGSWAIPSTSKFLRDLEHSREIKLEDFRRRGLGGKVLERIASIVARLL